MAKEISEVFQGQDFGPILFNICICGLGTGSQTIMIKSVEGVKKHHQIQWKTDINNLGDEFAKKVRFNKAQGAVADHNQKNINVTAMKKVSTV